MRLPAASGSPASHRSPRRYATRSLPRAESGSDACRSPTSYEPETDFKEESVMTTVEAMDRRRLSGLGALFAAALVALSGCATMRRHEAASTEQLLAAAGFQMRPANSPEQLRDLATMPPLRLVSRSKDGAALYTYADPENCHCLYVGG